MKDKYSAALQCLRVGHQWFTVAIGYNERVQRCPHCGATRYR